MRAFTLLFNIALLIFICTSLLADGLPVFPIYIAFTVLAMFTLIYSSVILILNRGKKCRFPKFTWKETGVERSAGRIAYIYKNYEIIGFISNVVFFGFVCWALLTQIQLPDEKGIIMFTVMMIFAPVLNLLALLCCRL